MNNPSLYEVIKERIRTDLLQNPQGQGRLPSERELQDRYGVSRPTISKALTALAGEGFLTRQARRGNFVAAPAGENGRRSVAVLRQVGYVAPLAQEELVQRAFRGIDRVAHRRGFQVLMGNAGNDIRRERDAVMEFVASGADGIIVTPVPRRCQDEENDYLRADRLGIPVVLMDTCLPEQGGIQVLFDNRRLGHAMTDWLIREGHRRIALLTYVDDILHGPLSGRAAGYRDALRDNGLADDPTLVRRLDTSLDHPSALNACLDAWQELPEPPTAIIAPEDTMALELIALLMARGVRVPDTIRVVGFDNRSTASHFDPPIPTSAPDFERMGDVACSLLIEAIETGNASPRTVLLDVPLLIRKRYAVASPANGGSVEIPS